MIVGIVCARNNSEGLPGKNFSKLCGKTLIDWTVDVALKTRRLDCVVIVTDNESYRPPPHTTVLLEPEELAGPTVAKWDVWRWASEHLEGMGRKVDAIVDLDVTRPIRTPQDVEDCISLFYAPPPNCHVVMGITRARKSPYFDLLETDERGRLHLSKPATFSVRQECESVWEHAGVYIVDRAALQQFDGLFTDGLLIHGKRLAAENGLDIDDDIGWEATVAWVVRQQKSGRHDVV